jgi:hypothetical protein
VSLRKWINERAGIGIAIACATLLAGAVVLGLQLRNSRQRPTGSLVWYTTDDGKSWFPESALKLPPFDHEGKKAYRCYVFACKDGAEYVSHLERLPADLKKRMDAGGPVDPMMTVHVEVKDPGTGETGWIRQTDPKASEIMSPRCPKHPNEMGDPVAP